MGIDPIIYIVAASVFSVICGLLAFRTVAAERKEPGYDSRHYLKPTSALGNAGAIRSLKDILAIGVGSVAAAGAIFYFYKFVTNPNPAGERAAGWIALGLAAVSFVCFLIYFLGHVAKEEEIHVIE